MIHHRKMPATGFTLVELAIVITIIGILIGGVLKGQQLIDQAKLAATTSQIHQYRTAIRIFQSTYDELPGDMIDPDARIVGCSDCKAVEDRLGDGYVYDGDGRGISTISTDKNSEEIRFWLHLLKADMISGVTDAALTSEPIAWGATAPAAKIGGGFHAESGMGNCRGDAYGYIWPDNCQPNGLTFVLRQTTGGNLYNSPHYRVLTPMQAAQIDRKIDDGVPYSGDVLGYSRNIHGCMDAETRRYPESLRDDAVCGLGISAGG